MTRYILALAFALPASVAFAAPASRSVPLALDGIEARGLEILASRFLAHEHPDADLEVTRVTRDDLRAGHVRVRQTFAGIPVFEGEAIVHLDQTGSPFHFTDRLVRGVVVDPRPNLSLEQAIDLAILHDGRDGDYTEAPKADLLIFARDGEPRLAWRVQLKIEDGTDNTSMPVVFVDAHTGEPVFQYDNLQTGSGTSLYSGTVPVDTYKRSGTWYLEDVKDRFGTFDMRNSYSLAWRFADSDDVWSSSSQRAGVDAHFGTEVVLDYFRERFGRNGIDGRGGPAWYVSIDGTTPLLSARVHYGSRYNNAYWDGTKMTYGDGDGSLLGPLVTIDIAGHEMTHGITQYTAGLTYSGESGALNESMSDVFGTLIEFYTYGEGTNGGNWWIGEDAYTPGKSGDALRYMDDPHKADNYGYTADDDPDHYSERYKGSSDNGGVHINSGIANKVFYLLAQGGAHHRGGSMSGIGKERAGRIWYYALTEYMTSATNFAGARAATIAAAAALYGASSPEATAVGQAWSLCGVK